MTGSPTGTYEPIIGLEVHAQIVSESKMFCPCSARYFGAAPNSHVCAVCGGFPGALPVINRRGVEATAMTGLALGCTIAPRFKFDRKNYAYPDLPKGYQITQYDLPIARHGALQFRCEGQSLSCGITRVHLEEDTGKLTHVAGDEEVSLIDYNRSGVPLMEIVGEPDLRSAQAAREYFVALRELLVYLGVSDGNLQEGSLRADVNVSLRLPDGSWGTKVEIKNLNSFRAVQRAVEYEVARQRTRVEAGRPVIQETRGWSEEGGETLPQRSKEYAHDYRYFPEPDLPPVDLTEETLSRLAQALPELPAARRARLAQEHGLEPEITDHLTANKPLGDFYEMALGERRDIDARLTARWLTQTVQGVLNEQGLVLGATRLTPSAFAELISLVQSGRITDPTAKEMLPEVMASGSSPAALVEQRGLTQITDAARIRDWVREAMEASPRAVTDYLRGKDQASQAIIGRVRGASRGQANMDAVRRIVQEELDRRRRRAASPDPDST